MKIIDIAIKDMLRSLRSAMGVVFMFAIPLGVTGLFYVMFGNIANSDGFELPRTALVVANLDQGSPPPASWLGEDSRWFQCQDVE